MQRDNHAEMQAPEPAEAFWATGPKLVHQLVAEMFANRMKNGELRAADPVGATHPFLALCTGRFWSPGLFAIRPTVTKAEVNRYVDQIIEAFLSLYAP